MAEGKNGLLVALGMDKPEGGEKMGSGSRNAEARMLKKALDAGDGEGAYRIFKGWVQDCMDEPEPAEEKSNTEMEGRESEGY